MTKEQVEKEFRAELNALLKKWNAELECKDYYPGYPESGEDVRMTVTIPAIYRSNETLRECTEIDLGNYLTST